MRSLPVFLCLFPVFSSLIGFSQEESVFQPVDISFDLDKLKMLDFGSDSLDRNKLLFQLFPAPMNEDDPELSEWRVSAFWKCSSCVKQDFVAYQDEEMIEKETLPYDANYTICTNILYYQSEKGSLRAIASFSTSLMNDGTGRFTRGLLSLAHLEKQNGKWELLNFEPFVNLQGTFTVASPVDEVMIGENGKTYLLIHGGEANGVSAEEYMPWYQGLYVLDGETLRGLFTQQSASCTENGPPVGSNWTTTIKDIKNVADGVQFTLETKGLLVKEFDWYRPTVLQYVNQEDFDHLPARFEFEATMQVIKLEKRLQIEKPVVSIRYKDEKGIIRTQAIATHNTDKK
ncbi:hypothetical protein [Fluviicola sp.]|uniref:hypothetical protein n=1 Tax=Fluviicola sp. TaxID=1917219 RepID=UPI0031DADD6F